MSRLEQVLFFLENYLAFSWGSAKFVFAFPFISFLFTLCKVEMVALLLGKA